MDDIRAAIAIEQLKKLPGDFHCLFGNIKTGNGIPETCQLQRIGAAAAPGITDGNGLSGGQDSDNRIRGLRKVIRIGHYLYRIKCVPAFFPENMSAHLCLPAPAFCPTLADIPPFCKPVQQAGNGEIPARRS